MKSSMPGSPMRTILLATNNPHKVREYKALLRGIPFTLVTPADRDLRLAVEESGSTLEENAIAKAREYAAASGLLALSDDSGLEVEALGGEPGVKTARYAGPDASDEERNQYLLRKLKGLPLDRRDAVFRCVIAIAEPNGQVRLCEGRAEGYIAMEPRGAGGWGYDPVFLLPALNKTLAELSPAQKNRYSHRGRAGRAAKRLLAQIGAKEEKNK